MFVDVWQNSNNMVTRTVTTSLQERITFVHKYRHWQVYPIS